MNQSFRIVVGLAVLIGFSVLGQQFVALLNLPIPGSLLGMLLLFLILLLADTVPAFLTTSSQLLLRHLSLFFIPPVLAVLLLKDTLLHHWPILLAALTLSTLLGLYVTAWLAQRQLRRGHKG